MTLTVLTLFPELVESYFATSIAAKAVEREIIVHRTVNIRDYARDRHATCDDAPYGGGAGMVLMPGPLSEALDSVGAAGKRTLFPTPSGRLLTAAYAQELAEEQELVLICGRYEGIDQRIIDQYVDDEISIGDYVISSGEIAALVVIDAVFRLREGAINRESLREESFTGGLLEYPHYTRPELFAGRRVPEVLLSGHHAKIQEWRLRQSVLKTKRNRPDLFDRLDDGLKRYAMDETEENERE